jgi:hypothetical protein
MPKHFWDRTNAGKANPGMFIVSRQRTALGGVIDSLLLVWAASEPDEWRNRIVYLPFPK